MESWKDEEAPRVEEDEVDRKLVGDDEVVKSEWFLILLSKKIVI